MKRSNLPSAAILFIFAVALMMAGCDNLVGTKKDGVTDEIFDAGRREPQLLNEVEYVPLFPFFTLGADGAPFDEPEDIYVGFDELIYVVDKRGLHVLDRSGNGALFVDIPGGGTSVVQDRRLHVYVTARKDTVLDARNWNLPVVLHFDRFDGSSPRLVNTIWHPFDEDSRKYNLPDPLDTDEEVSFTGVGVLFDNSIYVSRRGPINSRSSVILPHNAILQFRTDGVNVSAIPLHPTMESLRSSLYPTDVTTYVHPPQRAFFPQTVDFIVAQSPLQEDVLAGGLPPVSPLRYSVLSIRAVITPDGLEYQSDAAKLQIAADPQRGDGFLYDDFKFSNPTDVTIATDETNYMFVLDAGKDSLFVFTSQGVEGVAPPPGSRSSIPVVVSFGGTGDRAEEFNRPNGVAYFDKIVYVADTGNSRISRFRLNTDFE